MKFRAKFDWWLLLIIIGWIAGNLWALVQLVLGGGVGNWIIVITFTPFTVFFFIPVWLRSYYLFSDDGLHIKFGLGKGTVIPYESIITAFRTRNPISAAAPSLDRIEIVFKRSSFNDTVLISPKDQQGFFEQLKSKNENVLICNEIKPVSKLMKLIISLCIGIPLIMVGYIFIYGEMEPVVNVSGNGIQINAMYGIDIDFSGIESITLIEQSLREIRSGEQGQRTNGYGGFGGTLKGHFSSPSLGSHMLFVRADSSPTIRIERIRDGDVFISFRDSNTTRAKYNAMIKSFNRINSFNKCLLQLDFSPTY